MSGSRTRKKIGMEESWNLAFKSYFFSYICLSVCVCLCVYLHAYTTLYTMLEDVHNSKCTRHCPIVITRIDEFISRKIHHAHEHMLFQR